MITKKAGAINWLKTLFGDVNAAKGPLIDDYKKLVSKRQNILNNEHSLDAREAAQKLLDEANGYLLNAQRDVIHNTRKNAGIGAAALGLPAAGAYGLYRYNN